MNKLLWIGLLLLSGCQFLSKTTTEVEDPERNKVARVFESFLYEDDLIGLVPSNASKEDSADIVRRYVDSWIRKQLILTKASENSSIDDAEIERRVQDYRYQLIVYGYQKQFVESNLDTVVSEKDIQDYYEANTANFELKKNIIKGLYLKIPKEAPQKNKVRRWLTSNKAKDFEKLSSYTYSYADKFVLNDSIWVEFDDIIANTPFSGQVGNVVNTLKTQNLLETEDETFNYYIKIKDYKISDNEFAPIELVYDQIRNIIINKRKIELQKAHEKSIYEIATRENNYEIY